MTKKSDRAISGSDKCRERNKIGRGREIPIELDGEDFFEVNSIHQNVDCKMCMKIRPFGKGVALWRGFSFPCPVRCFP